MIWLWNISNHHKLNLPQRHNWRMDSFEGLTNIKRRPFPASSGGTTKSKTLLERWTTFKTPKNNGKTLYQFTCASFIQSMQIKYLKDAGITTAIIFWERNAL
jgi:hypothetical protein